MARAIGKINYKVPSLKTWGAQTAGTDDVEATKIVAEDWVYTCVT
jgi:hypothetical protein